MEERAEVLARLEGRETAISAGGSLSNTLLALARLSAAGVARWGGAPLRVGMAGLVGSDPLGGFFTAQVSGGGGRLGYLLPFAAGLLAPSASKKPALTPASRSRPLPCPQMRQAGVDVVSPPLAGAATGTVVVLTAQDASRTMLSYLGTPAEVEVDAALEAAIARSRCLVVEGGCRWHGFGVLQGGECSGPCCCRCAGATAAGRQRVPAAAAAGQQKLAIPALAVLGVSCDGFDLLIVLCRLPVGAAGRRAHNHQGEAAFSLGAVLATCGCCAIAHFTQCCRWVSMHAQQPSRQPLPAHPPPHRPLPRPAAPAAWWL